MQLKKYEKLLQRKCKKVAKARDKIEYDDLTNKESIYTNPDGTIDWNRLAKHVREATSGR